MVEVELSPLVLVFLILISLAIFVLMITASFGVYFNDTTQTEIQIYNIIRNKENPQFIDSQGVNVEPMKDIFISLVIHLQSRNTKHVKEYIDQILEKYKQSSISDKTYEIICIIPENASVSKSFDYFSKIYPKIIFFTTLHDPIDDFKQAVIMAKGQYVLNTKFIEQELADFSHYDKQFISIATPMNTVRSPLYNHRMFSYPIFVFKPAGMVIFSRLHSTGQKAQYEIDYLCSNCHLTTYYKNYIFSDFSPSLIEILSVCLWKNVIITLFKHQYWTIGKSKRRWS